MTEIIDMDDPRLHAEPHPDTFGIAAKVEYELDHLAPSERDAINANRETYKRLTSGGHLQEWLSLAPGLLIQRRKAMLISNSNAPKGRRYVEAFNALLQRNGVNVDERKLMPEITAILFITSDPENQRVLDEALAQMSQGQVARLNLPTSAASLIRRELKAAYDGPTEAADQTKREAPFTILKRQHAELIRKTAHLEEQLAAAERRTEESHCDFSSDSADDIAVALVGNGRRKARAVIDAALKLLSKSTPTPKPKPRLK